MYNNIIMYVARIIYMLISAIEYIFIKLIKK